MRLGPSRKQYLPRANPAGAGLLSTFDACAMSLTCLCGSDQSPLRLERVWRTGLRSGAAEVEWAEPQRRSVLFSLKGEMLSPGGFLKTKGAELMIGAGLPIKI